MSLFKKRKIETSNDYYEAYKAEIGIKSEKKKILSFANILKAELAVLALGLFLMNQNNISVELKTNTMATNSFLPVSVQEDNENKDLVVQLEEEVNVGKLDIREDDFQEALDSEFENNDIYAQNEAMKLLIESLKLEIKNKPELHASNRIIISQN